MLLVDVIDLHTDLVSDDILVNNVGLPFVVSQIIIGLPHISGVISRFIEHKCTLNNI